MLSSVVAYGAFVVAAVFAGSWCYWIWVFDWGRLWSRGYGLWGMTFLFGGIITFFIGLFGVMVLHSWLFPER
jgi:hypothetical protein